MAAINKGYMLFVDGENLTFRAQELARKQGFDITDERAFPFYKPDVYFWPQEMPVNGVWWTAKVHVAQPAQRCYYYTSTGGGDEAADAVHDARQSKGFSPVVVHKPARQKKAKGVDISLTKDMLLQGFLNNYDVAALVAGDGDYLPVIEELKRLGKWVIVSFFDDDNGLSPKLRRPADQYVPFNLLAHGVQPRTLVPSPARAQIYLEIDPVLKKRLIRLGERRTPVKKLTDEALQAFAQYLETEEAKLGLLDSPMT
jgi:hypothetical protein